MQTETKTVIAVLATVVLVVASSFAALGYFANHAVALKAGDALAKAPDVQQVAQRANMMLIAAAGFWLAASLLFARALPHRPEQGARSYVTSTVLVTIGVVVTTAILRFTATALQLF